MAISTEKLDISKLKTPTGIPTIKRNNAQYQYSDLRALPENPKYLEIGSWAGSTVCSAIYGNKVKALCIDNWLKFDAEDHLKKVYCNHIGIEYMYIRNPEVRKWIQNRLSVAENQPQFSAEQKKHILANQILNKLDPGKKHPQY